MEVDLCKRVDRFHTYKLRGSKWVLQYKIKSIELVAFYGQSLHTNVPMVQ